MAQQEIQHGILATVTGEIIPYAFTADDDKDKKDGEAAREIAGINLRIPGDVVKVQVDGDLSRRLQTGETWTITGRAIVQRPPDKPSFLKIFEVHSMKRLIKARSKDTPIEIDWGDQRPAAPSTSSSKGSAA